MRLLGTRKDRLKRVEVLAVAQLLLGACCVLGLLFLGFCSTPARAAQEMFLPSEEADALVFLLAFIVLIFGGALVGSVYIWWQTRKALRSKPSSGECCGLKTRL